MGNFNVAQDNKNKKKIVFIMGATGTGKSKLSIDLATRFPFEVINSDKMQFYKGLDIITNKMTDKERHGVPHHLLGFLESDVDFTTHDFCHHAMIAINRIFDNGHLPIIVGGSNSYIEVLVEDPMINFKDNFDCCFLWMDVSLPVLYKYVAKRVDQMVEAGLVDEVRGMFVPGADYTRGIRRSIGAPEMESYFQKENELNDDSRKKLLNVCIQDIKDNTCNLINNQLKKIRRLRTHLGWKLHRLDATQVFESSGNEAKNAWNELVLNPAMKIVSVFLKGK